LDIGSRRRLEFLNGLVGSGEVTAHVPADTEGKFFRWTETKVGEETGNGLQPVQRDLEVQSRLLQFVPTQIAALILDAVQDWKKTGFVHSSGQRLFHNSGLNFLLVNGDGKFVPATDNTCLGVN
jgi:hypothetical protein